MQGLPVLHSYLQQQMCFCLSHNSLLEQTDMAGSVSDTDTHYTGYIFVAKWGRIVKNISSSAAGIVFIFYLFD